MPCLIYMMSDGRSFRSESTRTDTRRSYLVRPSPDALPTMFTSKTRTALAVSTRRQFICRECLRHTEQLPLGPISYPRSSPIRSLHESSQPPKDDAPFRKFLKDEAKRRKREDRITSASDKLSRKAKNAPQEKWELTVGIEVHAELNTARKLFSSAATSVNEIPNSHVALFDASFPGSQPHFQKETLIPALRAALALNCTIPHKSSFDRKHYFYQDQPAGYQITQYYGWSNFHSNCTNAY